MTSNVLINCHNMQSRSLHYLNKYVLFDNILLIPINITQFSDDNLHITEPFFGKGTNVYS